VLSFFPHNLLAKIQPLKRVYLICGGFASETTILFEQENGDAAHYSGKRNGTT
jgi:hypothetical protein